MHVAAGLGPAGLLKAGGVTALDLTATPPGWVTQIRMEPAWGFPLPPCLLFVDNPLLIPQFHDVILMDLNLNT